MVDNWRVRIDSAWLVFSKVSNEKNNLSWENVRTTLVRKTFLSGHLQNLAGHDRWPAVISSPVLGTLYLPSTLIHCLIWFPVVTFFFNGPLIFNLNCMALSLTKSYCIMYVKLFYKEFTLSFVVFIE